MMVKVNGAMTGRFKIYFHAKRNNGSLPKINPLDWQMTFHSHNRVRFMKLAADLT